MNDLNQAPLISNIYGDYENKISLAPFMVNTLIEQFIITQPTNIDIDIHLSAGSRLLYIPIFFGHNHAQVTLNINLEENAECIVNGAFSLWADGQLKIKSYQNHFNHRSISRCIINGLVWNCARVEFRGMISIESLATNANAFLENKTIICDQDAQAISVPCLEIKTNEVSCSHASAIGQLNQEQIWYLRARGLDFDKAKQLLLSSFFYQTLSKIDDFQVKDQVIKRLIKKEL